MRGRRPTVPGPALAFALAITMAIVPTVAARAARPGDAEQGRVVYQTCLGCHSVDEDDVGPRHRGVIGRRAGSVPGYAYSPSLRSSGIVWDADLLDRWLRNPQALVPGSRMFFALSDEQARADVIAYLATLR